MRALIRIDQVLAKKVQKNSKLFCKLLCSDLVFLLLYGASEYMATLPSPVTQCSSTRIDLNAMKKL